MHIIMLECEQSVRGDDMAGGLWFFDVLGIAPTKDKTAIKRAFSRLAHETNPEDDQEGYIKLHDAYRVALAYADGKHIQVIDEDEVSHVNAEEMDFSSLKISSEAIEMDETELENAIYNFKTSNMIYTYDMVFGRSKEDFPFYLTALFRLYSALADKRDSKAVLDKFFSEPIVAYCIENEYFRTVLKRCIPQDVNHSKEALEFIRKYETSFVFRENYREQVIVKYKKEDEQLKLWGILTILSLIAPISYITLDAKNLDVLTGTYYDMLAVLALGFGFGSYCFSRYVEKKKFNKDGKTGRFRPILIAGLIFETAFNCASWFMLIERKNVFGGFNYLTAFLCGLFSLINIVFLVLRVMNIITGGRFSIQEDAIKKGKINGF